MAVVADHDAATVTTCLDALDDERARRMLDAEVGAQVEVDVVVVDLDSDDGSADAAIRHPLPVRVFVAPRAGLDRVLDEVAVDGTDAVLVLPASDRPAPGWLEAGIDAVSCADLVLGPGSGLRSVGVRLDRLGRMNLFPGDHDTEEARRRVWAAGGVVLTEPGLRTEGADPSPARSTLPVVEPARARGTSELVTVALCTRGRLDGLRRCLASLAALADDAHEIVVIDNHAVPTVDTTSLPANARVVHEPRRGLDIARNRALAEASGTIVAFVDDDCEVDPHWLAGLRAAFDGDEVVAVCGRVRPAALGAPTQRWFEVHFGFDRGLRRKRFTPWDRREWYPLWGGQIGTGANMAFRAGAVDAIGGFDELLDMGTPIGGGGDLDVLVRLLDTGAILEYAPDALVWHHHRATEPDLRRQFWGYGTSVGALLTKTVLDRPGLRVAAIRFFLDRLRLSVRYARQHRAGIRLPPVRMLAIDVAGQFVGPLLYLRARRAGRQR